ARLRPHVDAGRRGGIVVAAEQIVQEAAGPGPGRRRGVRVLRAATVLRKRGQDRAALAVAIGAAHAARAQALEIVGDLIEIGAHLLDAGVDRTALRRLGAELREEAGAFAAHAFGLHGDAVELALLLGGGVLIAADLLVLGGIVAA